MAMTPHSGIDVSTYQGDINWARVKAASIEFAMIRASFGSGNIDRQTDSRFHKNAYNAAVAGLLIGAYHTTFATTADQAHREAELFLKAVDGYRLAYPVAIDIEDYMLRNLPPEIFNEVARTWCDDIRVAGYYPLIFAKVDSIKKRLSKELSDTYDLWISERGETTTYDGKCGIHQYSSDKISGIYGPVNCDRAYQDYDTIIYRSGLNGFSPQQPELGASDTPELSASAEPKPAEESSPASEAETATVPPPEQKPKAKRKFRLPLPFSLSPPAPPPPTPPPPASQSLSPSPQEQIPDTVTVNEGDTLYNIASRYGLTARALYMYAGNREVIGVIPENIRPGMALRVPCKPRWPAPVLRVGAKVEYSGILYRSSFGGHPGSTIQGVFTLTKIVNGRKAGGRLDKIGWAPLSDLKIVT